MRLLRLLGALAAFVMSTSLIFFAPSPASAAGEYPARVQANAAFTNSNGGALAAPFNSNVVAGNLIIASSFYYDFSGSNTMSCSDTQGNTYSVIGVARGYGGEMVGSCYTFASVSGALTLTMTWTEAQASRRLLVSEFSGVAGVNSVDRTSGNVDYASAGDTVSTGAVTTTYDGDLLYAAFAANAGFTSTSGMTSTGAAAGVFAYYSVKTTAGSFNATATIDGSQNWAAYLIAFRPLSNYASASVSGTVNPSFSFTVATHSGTCNGFTQTGTGSATSAALGRVTAGTPGIAAQDLIVASNANSGYAVKIKSSGPLSYGGTSIAAVPGTNAAPAAFPATGTAAFGYTVSGLSRFSNAWASVNSTFADAMTGSTTGAATSCIAFKAQVTALTPAGSYTTTAIYSAVPAF